MINHLFYYIIFLLLSFYFIIIFYYGASLAQEISEFSSIPSPSPQRPICMAYAPDLFLYVRAPLAQELIDTSFKLMNMLNDYDEEAKPYIDCEQCQGSFRFSQVSLSARQPGLVNLLSQRIDIYNTR